MMCIGKNLDQFASQIATGEPLACGQGEIHGRSLLDCQAIFSTLLRTQALMRNSRVTLFQRRVGGKVKTRIAREKNMELGQLNHLPNLKTVFKPIISFVLPVEYYTQVPATPSGDPLEA